MARLSIGVDVSGTKAVTDLENAVGKLTGKITQLDVALAKSGKGPVSLKQAVTELTTSFRQMGASADKAFSNLSGLINGTSAYAQAIKRISGYNHEFIATQRAKVVAYEKLVGIEQAYVSALAAEKVASSSAAAQMQAKTAAINAQVAAYKQLAAAGLVTGRYKKGTDYTGELAEIERMKRSLKELEQQFARTASNRAALGLGNRGGSAGYASQMNAEAALYDDKGRLKYAINNMKDYEAAMKQASVESTAVARAANTGAVSVGGLGESFNKASKSSRAFHDSLRGASGAMGNLWMTYGQIIPLMAGFAAVAIPAAVVTKGADLDYTVRSIEMLAYGYEVLSQNSELATTSLEGTRQAILDITDSTFNARDLGKGMLEFSRAGFNNLEENLTAIDQASKFAYIGQMDLSKAVELVVGQMTAFKGLKAEDAFNTMAVVADKTSIDLQQMSEAFKNTTSLGTVMGLEFQDVAVAIGVLGQAGIRGATAGAAINTMMYKLVAPTATARKKMEELGVAFDAFDKKTGKIKSIRQISFDLAELTKNLKPNQAAAMFESMVGLRGIKSLGALVDMAKNGTKQFNALTEAVKGSGTYLDGYSKLLDMSGQTQITKLKAELDNLFTSSYDNAGAVKALESLRRIVTDGKTEEAVQKITTIIIGLVERTVELTTSVLTVGEAFGKLPGVSLAMKMQGAILDGLINKIDQVGNGIVWLSDKFNRAANYLPDFVVQALGLKRMGVEAEAAAKSAEKAKVELAKMAGGRSEIPVENGKALEKLGEVDDYFVGIQERILELNRTPLQIVDAKIDKDFGAMLSTLTSGGMNLDQMSDLMTNYIAQIKDLGTESAVAAKAVARVDAEIAKGGGDAAKWEKVKGLVLEMAEALNAKEMEKAVKETLANLRKEWQSYADKVIELQDKIAGTQRTLAEKLRSIDQSNMEGLTLWKDKKKEAEEYAAAAKKAGKEALAAFARGDGAGVLEGQKLFALAEEMYNKAGSAAESLATKVTGGSTAMAEQYERAEATLKRMQAQQTAFEASRGKKDKSLKQQIKRQEAAVKALEVRKTAAESSTVLSKTQGAEEAKRILRDLAAEEIKLTEAVQNAMTGQMKRVEGEAGGADMTVGMDAAKAKWISNWLEMKDSSTQNMAAMAETIQVKMDTINFPTQRWRESIFNMKGMFVEAVDEMSRRLEAEGGFSGTGKRYTNAQPTSQYAEALKKIEADVEAARNKASAPINTQVQVNATAAAETMGNAIKQGGAAVAAEIGKAQVTAISTAKVAPLEGTGLMTGFGGGLEPERIAAINAQLAETGRYISAIANSGSGFSGALNIPQVQQEVDVFKAELERAQAAYETMQRNIDQSPENYSLDQKLEVAQTLEDLQQAQMEIVKIQETMKASDPLSQYLGTEKIETEVTQAKAVIDEMINSFSKGGAELGLSKEVSELGEISAEVTDGWKENWYKSGEVAIEQVGKVYDSLKDLVNKDWTVKVNVEEARHLGGMLGGYHNGGMIQALASGGGVKNVLQGAYLPGFGGGDRRLLYGEDGEVMINKFAVAKATPQTALAFNRGDFGTVVDNLLTRFPHLLSGYAGGGMVSESATTSTPIGAQPAGYSSSFIFTDTTGQQGRVFGTEPDIKLLERAINKHNRFRSSNR